jgi:hypothetical protein
MVAGEDDQRMLREADKRMEGLMVVESFIRLSASYPLVTTLPMSAGEGETVVGMKNATWARMLSTNGE